jgi:hypothetical protein
VGSSGILRAFRVKGGSAMKNAYLAGIVLVLIMSVSNAYAEDVSIQKLPPVVVRTIPESGATNVDPALSEIRVTFSKDMQDGDWSCVNMSKDSYPSTTGAPRFDKDKRTFVMPVKLEPGKTYAILLNSDKYKNFMDTARRSAMPYLLVFETKK